MWTAKFVGPCLAEQSEVLNTPKSGPNWMIFSAGFPRILKVMEFQKGIFPALKVIAIKLKEYKITISKTNVNFGFPVYTLTVMFYLIPVIM